MAILAFPMTFFAHRGMTRFVLSGKNPGEDITEVVEEHFGVGAGKLITLLYFFAIYPILLVYSVAITNTVETFMAHQLHMTPAAARHSVADPDRRHDDHRAFRRADDCESDERAGVPIRYRADGAGSVSDPAVERRAALETLSLSGASVTGNGLLMTPVAGDPGDGLSPSTTRRSSLPSR